MRKHLLKSSRGGRVIVLIKRKQWWVVKAANQKLWESRGNGHDCKGLDKEISYLSTRWILL